MINIKLYKTNVSHTDYAQRVIMVIKYLRNNKKNGHEIQHIYLKWKRRLKGKVSPYDTSLPPATHPVILNKVFHSQWTGNLSKHS